MKRYAFCSVIAAVLLVAGSLSADWPQFRGPGGNARSNEKNLPEKWSDQENVAWKTALPGLGSSSPIVVGKRVFLTCYSGYAESASSPGDMNNLVRHVVCVDRDTGKIIWDTKVDSTLPESKYEGGQNTWHGYSSSTPVSDGKNVFVFFGKTGVLCFDLDGKKIWQTSVGSGVTGWGSANSPVLNGDLVIVNAAVESGALVALDKQTGKEKWRTGRTVKSWGTPTLVPGADGKSELVLSVPEKIFAVDPENGEELWNCEGSSDNYVCTTAISQDGIIYIVAGRGRNGVAVAIRPGGRGDVTDSHVLWRKPMSTRVPSPVFENGYLFWVNDQLGTYNCIDAKSGEKVFEERITPRPGTIYASMVAADRKLYCISQHNGVFVFAAKPKYELISLNVFADDDSRANASPAIDNGQILMRNDKFLYCIGKSAAKKAT